MPGLLDTHLESMKMNRLFTLFLVLATLPVAAQTYVEPDFAKADRFTGERVSIWNKLVDEQRGITVIGMIGKVMEGESVDILSISGESDGPLRQGIQEQTDGVVVSFSAPNGDVWRTTATAEQTDGLIHIMFIDGNGSVEPLLQETHLPTMMDWMNEHPRFEVRVGDYDIPTRGIDDVLRNVLFSMLRDSD